MDSSHLFEKIMGDTLLIWLNAWDEIINSLNSEWDLDGQIIFQGD